MAKPEALKIKFDRELGDDGKAKVTSGRKHRYKENPDPAVGVTIGTLYMAEHIVHRLGNPDSFEITITPAK